MKFILIIMIGSWVSPDRIEFDTLEQCELAANKLNYGKIVTACEIDGDHHVGISKPSNDLSGVL